MMLSIVIFGIFLLFREVEGLSAPRLLFQFSPKVRIENLTILPNSTLVVCNAFTAELFGINPLHGPSGAVPFYITSFAPHSWAVFGLTSVPPYSIAATASNFSFGDPPSVPSSLEPGSNVVYLVDLTQDRPKKKAFPVPTAGWLNGLTTIPGTTQYLLLADCLAGSLLRLDTRSGSVEVVSSDPLFASSPSSVLPIGINGIHATDGWLYFTNTDLRLYGRLAITKDGLAAGMPAEVIAHGINGSTFDDFALGKTGSGYIATGLGPTTGIEKVSANGRAGMVAQWEYGSPNISQPVSAVLGQTRDDKSTLYFATAGQYFGTNVAPSGAQVFALEVDCKDRI